MTNYVRVRLENGVYATVDEDLATIAELHPLDPEDHPALDVYGKPVEDDHSEAADVADDSEDTSGVKPTPVETTSGRPVIPSPPPIIPPVGS